MKRKAKVTILLTGLLGIFLVGTSKVQQSIPERPFDATNWKKMVVYGYPTASGTTSRVEMVDALLANHLNIGMRRRDVHRFLGGPSIEDGSGDNGPFDIYWLVNKPGLFQPWQIKLWLRYRTSSPSLRLEYSKDSRLIDISVA
ncbi:hypothetical protein EON80_12410 [bacterium]|nr:MAG: hypothetical protein EON80_12410 [bacterium]